MTTFKDNLRRRQIDYQEHTSNQNEIRICCPFCSERGKSNDTEFKLGVNIKTNFAHCFRCDYKTRHATEALIRKFSLGPVIGNTKDAQEKKPEKIETPEHSVLLYKDWDTSYWTRKAFNYLEERGIGVQVMREKMVLFTEVGRYSHRVIFPVIAHEQLVGLVARAILKSQDPRYLNTPGMKAIWNIPDKASEHVLLCEGVIKGLALESVLKKTGIQVGALLGHSISPAQISQLKGAKTVTIFPDPDSVGIEGAIKVAYRLKNKFDVYMPKEIPTKQADELDPKELLSVVRSITLFSDSLACRYKFVALKRGQQV